jgi:hypothetical protein
MCEKKWFSTDIKKSIKHENPSNLQKSAYINQNDRTFIMSPLRTIFFFHFFCFSAKLVRTITFLSFQIGQLYLVCGCMTISRCVAYHNDLHGAFDLEGFCLIYVQKKLIYPMCEKKWFSTDIKKSIKHENPSNLLPLL